MTDPPDADAVGVGLKPGPSAAIQDPANVLKGKIMDNEISSCNLGICLICYIQ